MLFSENEVWLIILFYKLPAQQDKCCIFKCSPLSIVSLLLHLETRPPRSFSCASRAGQCRSQALVIACFILLLLLPMRSDRELFSLDQDFLETGGKKHTHNLTRETFGSWEPEQGLDSWTIQGEENLEISPSWGDGARETLYRLQLRYCLRSWHRPPRVPVNLMSQRCIA